MTTVITARINNINQPRVRAISYGRTALVAASDFNTNGLTDGSFISYQANTQSFVAESPNTLIQNIQNTLVNLDAGFF
jgi:hypothetical protein